MVSEALAASDGSGPVVAIVQARVESKRLPGKVLRKSLGKTFLQHLLERLKRSKTLDDIVLAIPTSGANDELEEIAEMLGIQTFRGSEIDVLDRFLGAANSLVSQPRAIVRITADCPLIDWEIVDLAVSKFFESGRYVGTGLSYPDGTDVQVFSFQDLVWAHENARSPDDREHVTPIIIRMTGDEATVIERDDTPSKLRITIDYPEDISVVSAILEHFGNNEFLLNHVLDFASETPSVFEANAKYSRNEGSTKSAAEKIRNRAERYLFDSTPRIELIPDWGESALPKSEIISQMSWNTVRTLDQVTLMDFASMKEGACTLGYADPVVEEAVNRALMSGVTDGRKTEEYYELAEQLVRLHKWSSNVQFAGSWFQAMLEVFGSMPRDKDFALLGGRGWLSSVLESLGGKQLSDGLKQDLGIALIHVRRSVRADSYVASPIVDASTLDLDSLFSKPGGLLMLDGDSLRFQSIVSPQLMAEKAKINSWLVALDETMSGFRSVVGGVHLSVGINPDSALLGGALGNGLKLNAILRSDTWPARSHSDARLGGDLSPMQIAAGLASLERMRTLGSCNKMNSIRSFVVQQWGNFLRKHGFDFDVLERESHFRFEVRGVDMASVRSSLVASMMSRGIIGSTYMFPSIAHDGDDLDKYLEALDFSLREISPRVG